MDETTKKIRTIKRILNMQDQINKVSKIGRKYFFSDLEIKPIDVLNKISDRLVPLFKGYCG